MIIGIDLDETLMYLLPHLNDRFNEIYKTNHKLEDFKSYRFEEVWGISKEKTVAFVRDFFFSEHYKKVKPIEYAVEAVKELKIRGHEPIIITARSPQFEEITKETINTHYDISKLILTGHKNMLQWDRRKWEVCKEYDVDFMIDDNQWSIRECIENGVGGILFGNYNWNQDNNLVRKANWKEVLDYIN